MVWGTAVDRTGHVIPGQRPPIRITTHVRSRSYSYPMPAYTPPRHGYHHLPSRYNDSVSITSGYAGNSLGLIIGIVAAIALAILSLPFMVL